MDDERSESVVIEIGERLIECAAARAAFVEREIAHGAKQPRPQCERGDALFVILFRQRFVRAQERVLHDFLRVECVLQNAVRVVEERTLKMIDELLEGAALTSVDGQREIVGRLHYAGLAAGPRVLHISKNTGFMFRVRGEMIRP